MDEGPWRLRHPESRRAQEGVTLWPDWGTSQGPLLDPCPITALAQGLEGPARAAGDEGEDGCLMPRHCCLSEKGGAGPQGLAKI